MRSPSSQHWAKAIGHPTKDVEEDTNGVRTRSHWKKGASEIAVPLGLKDNVSTLDMTQDPTDLMPLVHKCMMTTRKRIQLCCHISMQSAMKKMMKK